MSPSAPSGYAGDVSPAEAWDRLAADRNARLIDVRTQAEWIYVGVPDLAPLERQPLLISWQVFPAMTRNDAFAGQLAAQGIRPDDALYFLCRSGVRSRAAAEFLTAQGYQHCYNISDGFEGPLDDSRHRGDKGGWKAQGLPWAQG